MLKCQFQYQFKKLANASLYKDLLFVSTKQLKYFICSLFYLFGNIILCCKGV